jgi:hypothetical protein
MLNSCRIWSPQQDSTPPPSLILYIILYCTLTRGRGGGRVEPETRLEGQQLTKLGRKYQHDWLYLQSINSDKHLPQNLFTGQFFRWRHFALVSIKSLVHGAVDIDIAIHSYAWLQGYGRSMRWKQNCRPLLIAYERPAKRSKTMKDMSSFDFSC